MTILQRETFANDTCSCCKTTEHLLHSNIWGKNTERFEDGVRGWKKGMHKDPLANGLLQNTETELLKVGKT